MKNSKIFLLLMLILPWLTLPLIGTNKVKKYIPAAIFICTFSKAISIFGESQKWWKCRKGIFDLKKINFFILGPYFATGIWMLKKTYGNFPLYLISNTLLHISFIYFGGVKLAERFKIFSLNKMSKFQYLLVNAIRGLCFYGFHYIVSSNHNKKS